MTLSARNWAWNARWRDPETGDALPLMKEKLTLLAIAECENAEEGCAWPSIAHLAKMTGQSERTVRTHLKTLVERGVVAVEKRRSQRGRWMRNVYVLPLVGVQYREQDPEWMGHQEGEWLPR